MKNPLWYLLALFIITFVTYSNHFDNAFQFDDYPTITNNPSVTSLRSIPGFFTDPATTTGVANRAGFRPVLLTTFAIDYAITNSFSARVFHISSFAYFLVLLTLLFLFLRKELTTSSSSPTLLAFAATSLFATHPVIADCVNYIVQRGEILAGIGILAGLLLYRDSQFARRYFLYLIPPALGCLAKEVAYIFPLLLLLYVFSHEVLSKKYWSAILAATRAAFPALLALGSLAFFFVYLRIPETTISSVVTGNLSPSKYFATQLFIIPDYVRLAFLPIDLSGDTDWGTVPHFADSRIYVGVVCCLLLGVTALVCMPLRQSAMVGFGIIWFFICLAPTSSISPLTEVRNNHRLFLSYLGLIPALLQGIYLVAGFYRRWFVLLLPLAISCYGYATYERNIVWSTDESFWRDVTEKSPRNGRGHMNYGLVFMRRGDYQTALKEFEEALRYTPYYSILHVNLGIALTAMGQVERGESYFKEAQRLAPGAESSYFYYGRWLKGAGRLPEAAQQLQQALRINSRYHEAGLLLTDTLMQLGQHEQATATCKSLQQALNGDSTCVGILQKPNSTSLSGYISSTLALYNAKKFQECLSLARVGLNSFPTSHVLLNNAAVCALELKDLAIAQEYLQEALRIAPGFTLAENNLRMTNERTSEVTHKALPK